LDLKDGIIRTPLPPLTTFRDDPLRILRAVRFAGRFGFKCDAELCKAAAQPTVRSDLLNKVSRERYGAELVKILGQRTAVDSFELLCSFGLRSAVFRPPPSAKTSRDPAVDEAMKRHNQFVESLTPRPTETAIAEMSIQNPFAVSVDESEKDNPEVTRQAITVMRQIARQFDSPPFKVSDDDRQMALLAAFLSPYQAYRVEEKKKHYTPAVTYIVKESIKLPLRESKLCAMLLQSAQALARCTRLNLPFELDDQSRIEREKRLRKETGDVLLLAAVHWPTAFLLSIVLYGLRQVELSVRHIDWIVRESGLLGCWDWRPLFDGAQLQKDFGVQGSAIKSLQGYMLDWRFQHPRGGPEDCHRYLEEVMKEHPELLPRVNVRASKSGTKSST